MVENKILIVEDYKTLLEGLRSYLDNEGYSVSIAAAVAISVMDTGVGIPADDLPYIFERFYKADKARAGGGTGLGLSRTKHIVQAHGSDIRAESAEGMGSIFTFTLPIAPAS